MKKVFPYMGITMNRWLHSHLLFEAIIPNVMFAKL